MEVENKDPESGIEKLQDEQRASNYERQERSAAFLKWERHRIPHMHNSQIIQPFPIPQPTSSPLPQKPEAKNKCIDGESNTGPIEFRDV